MTREEYIEFANALKNNYTIDFDKLPEFCDMAISALSENKGDLISRQAVDELSKELVHTTRDKADFLCNFWERLQKLASVENKGEWTEWKGRNGRYNGIPVCSNCNTGFPIVAKDYKFCPNCGARMKGSE